MVVSAHRRFALRDVTFNGVALPGATLDLWLDDAGRSQWTARIVTRVKIESDEGVLTGWTADRREISGNATVANEVTPDGRREMVVEFHGSGELNGLTERPA